MKLITVTRFALCGLLLLIGASYAPSVHALPDYSVHSWYLTGCGSNLTVVGSSYNFCSGSYYQSGQQSGDWLEQTYTACNPDVPEMSNAIFEWCDGGWEERTTAGDCQCAH